MVESKAMAISLYFQPVSHGDYKYLFSKIQVENFNRFTWIFTTTAGGKRVGV